MARTIPTDSPLKAKPWRGFVHCVTRGIIAAIATAGLFSCSAPSPLERALKRAGDNRGELEKVLTHYRQRDEDSLKYKAACFLIENMPYHYTYGGETVEEYHRELLALVRKAEAPIIDSIRDRLRQAAGRLSAGRTKIEADIEHVGAEFLINHIDRVFLTRDYPWNKEVSFRDFRDHVLPYRINTEPLEEWLPVYTLASKPIADTLYLQSGSFREFVEKIVGFYTAHSPYIHNHSFPIETYPSTLLNIRYGTCHEITMWVTYIFRALGIPVYIDSTPSWANRSKGHNWNGITIDGVYYPFIFQDYTSGFGEHVRSRPYEIFSKVYRLKYAVQEESLFVQAPNEKRPPLFDNPFIEDVTAVFGDECADVSIALNSRAKRHRTVYLMVFNNAEWVPVGWTPTEGRSALFRAVHKNCCYLAAGYDGERFHPVSAPFLVDERGSVEMLVPDGEQVRNMVLRRKYQPGAMMVYAARSLGGEFHGSNDAEFRRYEVLHTVRHTLEDMKWHRVSVTPRAYKYARYYSAKGGYNNIAEINFLDADGNPLTGRIIGEGELPSDPSSYKESAFDGDPLTFFAAKDPDDSWVGLEFDRKTSIGEIRYLFRNDDNNVRKDDRYELFYWNDGGWNSLGAQTAAADSLLYENCPAGALFLLKNHTRGSEERIFTYAGGKQIWW